MTDPDVDAQLAALTARVHQDPPAASRPVEPWQPLYVREFATSVSELRERLDREQPQPSPFGKINAATALELAIAAIDAATRQATPHLPFGEDPFPVVPGEVAALIARLGQVGEALSLLVDQVHAQLSGLHLDALHDRIEGEPATTPHVEVERLIRDLIDVRVAAGSINVRAKLAVSRARRLRAAEGSPLD